MAIRTTNSASAVAKFQNPEFVIISVPKTPKPQTNANCCPRAESGTFQLLVYGKGQGISQI